jgi:hypothetical protein
MLHMESKRSRRRMGVVGAALVAASLLAGVAHGAERAGVRLPDQMNVRGQNLVLNGLGVREASLFNVDVYVAGLYVSRRSSDPSQILRPDEPKVVELVFVHDVRRDQMTKAWQEGFQKNAGARIAELQPRIDRLNGWMSDTKKGDALSFTYIPGQGVEVRAGGTIKGTIPGDDFAQALFAIWLGPHPPNEGLKAGMLGRK